MKLKANLQFQDRRVREYDCVVEKVIQLPGDQFDDFSKNLMKNWDFIRDNNDLIRYDGSDAYRCLLVTGEGRENGILVNSEGYDNARYSALIPNVHSIIAMNRYPALASLCGKLTGMADHIVNKVQKLSHGEGRASISMDALEEMSGIDVARNSTIMLTLASMLSNRPEIADWEIDKNEFVITPSTQALEQAHEQAPEQTMGM